MLGGGCDLRDDTVLVGSGLVTTSRSIAVEIELTAPPGPGRVGEAWMSIVLPRLTDAASCICIDRGKPLFTHGLTV